MPTPRPANATTVNTSAAEERDALARFIVDTILNDPDAADSLKIEARDALKAARYTVYEEIRRG